MKSLTVSAAVAAILAASAASATVMKGPCKCGPGTVQKGDVCVIAPKPPKVPPPPKAPPPAPKPVSTSASSAATASASARSEQSQQQQQQQQQQQAQELSGGNSANSYSSISSYQEVRQTPPAFAGSVQPTASCKNAVNGGASAPVAGISFGIGTKDKECDAREAAIVLAQLGRPDMALQVMCHTRAARDIELCKNPAPLAAQGDAVTHAELQEVERRIVTRTVAK